jgi:predicted regulator of Ras-like GTPase activity (Roadblock/LC7/MglB family)
MQSLLLRSTTPPRPSPQGATSAIVDVPAAPAPQTQANAARATFASRSRPSEPEPAPAPQIQANAAQTASAAQAQSLVTETAPASQPVTPVGAPEQANRAAMAPAPPDDERGASNVFESGAEQPYAESTSTKIKENPMSRVDLINTILRKLQNDSVGLEASALISEDGLMIASALTSNMEEARVAGMTATLLNLGNRAAMELRRGTVHEVVVRGDHGYAVLIGAGRGVLLLALTNETSKLGLIFFDMHDAVTALQKAL